MTGAAKPRLVGLDTVRILGIIAVVAGHLWGTHELPRIATYSWQVPIFFFLTGYLWKPGRPLAHEVSSRARSLLVPYAAWLVILGAIWFSIEGAHHDRQIGTDVFAAVYGGAAARGVFAPFWFLPVLFFAAVLLRFLERFPAWVAWAVAAAGTIAAYLFGHALSFTPLDIGMTFASLLFVLAGRTAQRFEGRVPLWGAVLMLAVAVAALATRVASPLDLKLGDAGTPVLSVVVSTLICAGLVYLARATLDRMRVPAAARISELAMVSTVILMTQTFFFSLIGTLATAAGIGHGTPLEFLGALIFGWALGLGLHRSPLSRLLVGVPRVRAAAAPGLPRTESGTAAGRRPARGTPGG